MSACIQELNNAVANMDEKQVNIVLGFVRDMLSKKSINRTVNTYKYEYPHNDTFNGGVKIGLFAKEKLLNENYNFDDCNDEVAKMFGV